MYPSLSQVGHVTIHQNGGRPKTQSGDTCATGVAVSDAVDVACSCPFGSVDSFCGVVCVFDSGASSCFCGVMGMGVCAFTVDSR